MSDQVALKLLSTTDAQVWAEEWCKIATRLSNEGEKLIDEGWMVTWFANAIETGRMHAARGETITEDSEEQYTFMGWIDFWISQASSASTRVAVYRCEICQSFIEETKKFPHSEWHRG